MRAIIGEEEVSSQRVIEVRNPATGEVVDTVPSLDRDKVREAIEVAYSSQKKLIDMSVAKRSRALLQVASLIRERLNELAVLMTKETGRPIKSSRGEIERTAQIFELASAEVRRVVEGKYVPLESYEFPVGNERRFALTRRDPIGVVAAITPFNFPAASFAHKVAPALAVGNTVVFKPSSLTPLTQIRLSELVLRVFPKGTLNVVTGDSSMIGDEFVSNDKVGLITFTGSASVGLDLASRAIKQGKRIIMELGGNDAMIVLEDADLRRAVRSALIGRFDFAGQFCNATKRVIVRKEIEGQFLSMLREELKRMKVGDPLDETVDVAPLISEQAKERMTEFLNDAVRGGGEVVFQLDVPGRGNYFPPTVFKVPASLKIRALSEETFGPILPVIPVETDEEAVQIANATEYGLDASIFTSNFTRAYDMALKLKVGTVVINDTTRLRWDNLPFGGVKKSGIGRESVVDTMMEMTESKLIVYSL